MEKRNVSNLLSCAKHRILFKILNLQSTTTDTYNDRNIKNNRDKDSRENNNTADNLSQI